MFKIKTSGAIRYAYCTLRGLEIEFPESERWWSAETNPQGTPAGADRGLG